MTCTGDFGDELTATHGRMDGILVAIVPPGGPFECNGDARHLHLQVQVRGAVYDVAVNLNVLYAELDAELPDGPWSEGWHAGLPLDYPRSLGLSSDAFVATTPGALAQKLEAELAGVRRISVFATAYGPAGAHDVHPKGASNDGAIALRPLSRLAHILAFRFSTDAF